MGTGGGLRDASNLLHERFLLIYGDSYLPIDYAGVWRALLDSQRRGLMVVYDNTLADTSVRNNVAIDGRWSHATTKPRWTIRNYVMLRLVSWLFIVPSSS